MATSQLFKVGGITGTNGVLFALKHNKRTLQSERGASGHIDVTRTNLNYALVGNEAPEVIAKYAKLQMFQADIVKPRKNGVMAVEIIFSLPINRHKQDTLPFFTACLDWVRRNLAGELLSFDIHLDESAPHAHALILPLIDGKMQGDKLKGDRGNIKRLSNLFYLEVASHYGLSRSENKRVSSIDKQSLEMLILNRLKNDPAMKSIAWDCIRDAIHRDPLPFAQKLSIKLPPKTDGKSRSFVEIMTSKGKGGNKNPS